MKPRYDVISIGNPLMDITANVSYNLLKAYNLDKGGSHLVDMNQSQMIQKELSEKTLTPGGSGANVTANVCTLGGKACFMGSVGKDEYGDLFEEMTLKHGVEARLARKDEPTGHAITLITPDNERTFAVYLGAAVKLKKDDVDDRLIKKSKVFHSEIYQLATKNQIELAIGAMEVAKANEVLVSLDLSNYLFVKSNLSLIKGIIEKYVDVLFMNKMEAEAFTGKTDTQAAMKSACQECDFVVMTLGEEGSIITNNGRTYRIPTRKADVVNTNGAGDTYLACILYGICNKMGIEEAGRLASICAARVVGSVGARLDKKPQL